MIINPGDPSANADILSNLAKNVARRMGFEMKPLDTNAVQDTSGEARWMCKFDGEETRVYRVQNGSQRFVHIEVGRDGLIDINDVEEQVRKAIEDLRALEY